MPACALLPTQCAVCRGWGHSRVCADCLRRFAEPRSQCHACAIGVPAGTALCGACVHQPPPFAHAVAGVDCAFPCAALVAAFKFRGALDLAPALAWPLADAARADPAPRPSLLLPRCRCRPSARPSAA
jgi:predicted amidophosphoribosyltransferase